MSLNRDLRDYGSSFSPRSQQPVVQNNTNSGGLGLTGALFLVFLVLKLIGLLIAGAVTLVGSGKKNKSSYSKNKYRR